MNRKIKRQIENEILHPTISEKQKERENEIKDILIQEKKKWELDRAEFDSNPLHWSNNKRKRKGLPLLRGKSNKNRIIKFHSFKPTPRIFFAIDDIIDELILLELNKCFNNFTEIGSVLDNVSR